ncbi:nrde protein [Trichococcus palustris]|jgi:uncharacterized protein with NRDE domain|uniref:Nrde protein n=1 Tax=Trichococcus palustris TaxID=140314 RepID=A0A143YGN8_9LACT|nr:NRDE family protein [Trichococcus palustris]CZQ90336.1 nrde protein [Trichococcus palustris]SFL11974.1 Uncharacterized conserved protein, contains NRDE domain [Trichococcus palustris]
MCLIVLQIDQHPRYKFIVAANRDEDYARPTMAAHFWPEYPGLLAGKDLSAKGTWLGITKQGRFAAITNDYTGTMPKLPTGVSRGKLVLDYLSSNENPLAYLQQIQAKRLQYSGFNLILGSIVHLYHYNNSIDEITLIDAGIHGISNATLDTPWPKVTQTKAALSSLDAPSVIDEEALFHIMADKTPAPDELLPDLPLPIEQKRAVSANFIETPHFGTRSTTLLLVDHADQVTFAERTYLANGGTTDVRFSFPIEPAES